MTPDLVFPGVTVASGASGAAAAARLGQVVVIVDVIDMSTTLEGALDAGAMAVLGASPHGCSAPVAVDPEAVGRLAGRLARDAGAGVVVVTEPRVGTDEQRLATAAPVLRGIRLAGGRVDGIVPNLGKETVLLADFTGQVVVAVTAAGGTAFDAALQAGGGGAVLTGTVARTLSQKGPEPARRAARRAVALAGSRNTGIAVVSASANAWEDVLGAQCIANFIQQEIFC